MKFVDAYKKKWGLEPEGYGTSSSYMAVYQLKDAIEKARQHRHGQGHHGPGE